MPLLGKAAVAMWWSVAPEHRSEFEDWHTHEHFPERMGIAGFERGSRWASLGGDDGWFVLYELQAYETLTSPQYLARLNAPTPWSVRMMPRHRGMVRSQCRVLASFGGGIAGHVLTLRLSPSPGRTDALHAELRQLLASLPMRPGLTAAHLLQTQTPAHAATTEQQIRGGADAVADSIVLVAGYDVQVLQQLADDELSPKACGNAGAAPGQVVALYRLSCTMQPTDLQDDR